MHTHVHVHLTWVKTILEMTWGETPRSYFFQVRVAIVSYLFHCVDLAG